MLIVLIFACGSGGDFLDSGVSFTPPTLHGVSGSGGTALWVEEPNDQWILEGTDGVTWEILREDSGPWFVEGQEIWTHYRLSHFETTVHGEAVEPESVQLAISPQRSALLAGETVRLDLGSPIYETPLSLGLRRQEDQWLSEECLSSGTVEECWMEGFQSVGKKREVLWNASRGEPIGYRYTLALAIEDSDGQFHMIEEVSKSVAELGRSVAWGDPHAHSNLSQDGCEVYEDACRSRLESAAADFFEQAKSRGLDFAAITDHAEYTVLIPEETDQEVDIWMAQQEFVLAADDGVFVPIVGYEWTNQNGHRSVIFEEIEVCPAMRASGKAQPGVVVRSGNGDELIPDNDVRALTPSDLWQTFEDANQLCAATRVLSIPHHTSMRLPTPVVWSEDANTPDETYERLVEVTSEHGTSECIDLQAKYCNYRIKKAGGYASEGSIQAMLQEGYRLGFVGGTDSHDSRPGSTEDSPSCVSLEGEDGSYACHDYSGGLTGVYYAGGLSRKTLFDGLEARNTMAATLPGVDVRAALFDGTAVYLPGEDVPAGEYLLLTHVPETQGAVLSIETLDQNGASQERTLENSKEVEVSLSADSVLYLRIRLSVDGVEERVWVSPFFGSEGL